MGAPLSVLNTIFGLAAGSDLRFENSPILYVNIGFYIEYIRHVIADEPTYETLCSQHNRIYLKPQ